MNILYLANVRLPTEKAHGAQIMKMCEAFAAYNPVPDLKEGMGFNTREQLELLQKIADGKES